MHHSFYPDKLLALPVDVTTPRRSLLAARRLINRAFAAGLIAGVLAGCAPPEESTEGEATGWSSLLDPAFRADVLVEARRIEPPPSLDGNRFLLGWSGWYRGGELWLWSEAALRTDDGRARLEIVNLDPRPRVLVLEVETSRPTAEGFELVDQAVPIRVETRCIDEGLGCSREALLPRRGRVEIELPALPTGRVAVDLFLPASCALAVRRAGLRQAWQGGETELIAATAEVRLGGWTAVDFVRRVATGARLRASFAPPAHPADGDRHVLWIEHEDGATRVFDWSADRLVDRWRGAREIDVAIDGLGERFVRVRLLSRGSGATATWRGLEITSTAEAVAEPAATKALEPPKRIVLYILDALRGDRAGHRGTGSVLMPELDRLAAEGVAFVEHQSVAPNTRPSTLALLSGRTPMSPRALRQLDREPLAEALRSAGYRTALFSDNGNVSPAWGMDRGFDDVVMGWKTWTGPQRPYNDSAERLHRSALEWLDALPEDQPAFLYLHVLNPHNPYHPPRELQGQEALPLRQGETDVLLRLRNRGRLPEAARRTSIRELYDASVRYADRELGRFARALAERYRPGELALAVTSDHGDEFFEHGGILHGYTLYEEQLSIPLVFWSPGRLEPRSLATPSDNLDLHETLRALAGAAPSEGSGTRGRGRSLVPHLLGGDTSPNEASGDRVRFAAAGSLPGGIFLARWREHKLIWAPRTEAEWGMGFRLGRKRDPEAVFDLANDPGEAINLAGEDRLVSAWLRAQLRAWVDHELAVERGTATEELTLDAETRENLRALGYVD